MSEEKKDEGDEDDEDEDGACCCYKERLNGDREELVVFHHSHDVDQLIHAFCTTCFSILFPNFSGF